MRDSNNPTGPAKCQFIGSQSNTPIDATAAYTMNNARLPQPISKGQSWRPIVRMPATARKGR